jgi:hypothetical protein
MGTAHGAEELGLCPHGLACQAGAWGRYMGFCLGYGHIWGNPNKYWPAKYFPAPITLAHDEIFDKRIFASKAWDAVDADRGIARVNRATRARAFGTCLRAQFGTRHL